jgi:hypothetical protein
MIYDIPADLDNFGFDISFCDDMLIFDDCTAGSMISTWDEFDYNEATTETIRVGGFDTVESLSAGTSGVLAYLNFTVSCPGCSGGEICDLDISHMTDDMEYWSRESGTFTFYNVTPTPLPIPATGSGGNILMLIIISAIIGVSFLRKR